MEITSEQASADGAPNQVSLASVDLPSTDRGGSHAVKISNLVVQLHRASTGRGPTKARTSIEANLITVTLRDTLTTGERTLISAGRGDLVRDMRRAFQEIMHDDLVAGIEELTGRKVLALLSDNHLDPDIAIETFLLEPVE
jgi:uncharacterized protein YbcI